MFDLNFYNFVLNGIQHLIMNTHHPFANAQEYIYIYIYIYITIKKHAQLFKQILMMNMMIFIFISYHILHILN